MTENALNSAPIRRRIKWPESALSGSPFEWLWASGLAPLQTLTDGPGILLDHLVGLREQHGRCRQTQRARRLQIDNQLECRGLLHREIGSRRATCRS
jgi:hypothetical protein